MKRLANLGGRVLDDQGRLRLPFIWIALALSLLLHAVALFGWWPHDFSRLPGQGDPSANSTPLRLRILPQASAPAPPATAAAPAARPVAPRTPPPTAQAQRPPPPPPKPPVIALKQPAPAAPSIAAPAPAQAPALSPPPSPPPPSPSVAAPAPPPSQPAPPTPPARSSPGGNDFMAALEARRRARGDGGGTPSLASIDDEKARRNQIVAGNLGLDRAPAFGQDARGPGGGIFQIQSQGFDRAEILYYGWNKEIRRAAAQVVEVRRGDNPDIRIAIVRKMIAIIREHEAGDFAWDSRRLGRTLNLSARPADNAGLEDVLMREFFEVRR